MFKSSQGDINAVTMEHQDPIISALSQEIDNQKVLKAILNKHT